MLCLDETCVDDDDWLIVRLLLRWIGHACTHAVVNSLQPALHIRAVRVCCVRLLIHNKSIMCLVCELRPGFYAVADEENTHTL